MCKQIYPHLTLDYLNHSRWSFGVLMWEIMTFGGIPYEEILPMDLKKLLSDGYRLPCPEITPPEL